jgi:hypothetical protein
VATGSTLVTVNPVPTTPTLVAAYNGAVVTLTSSAATGNQFYFNGVAIPGATSPTYAPAGATPLGAYTVVSTNAYGCPSPPSAPLVVTSPAQPRAGSGLSVYPNPSPDGRINVVLTGNVLPTLLSVRNALGQVVFSARLPGSVRPTVHHVDLPLLAPGMYLLRAQTTGGAETRRLVVE